MESAGNLFADVPRSLAAERIDVLVALRAVRIERIVSTGHATPLEEWFDQETHEWVVVLAGRARLGVADEPAPRDLRPGDWVFIPAHRRHRVEATDPDAPTVWLAVHVDD